MDECPHLSNQPPSTRPPVRRLQDPRSRDRPSASSPAVARRSERGQATAEYALVMLAAAALAGLLIAWAASTDGVGRLLDAVLDSIIEQAN